MVSVQRGGRFVFINAAGARMIGAQSPREVVGRRVLDFVLPDDHDAARASRPSAGAFDPVVVYEMRGRKLDGTIFELESAGFGFTYQGQPSALLFVRDITDRKLDQAQLVQNSKLAMLGELAATIANELNHPLTITRMAATPEE